MSASSEQDGQGRHGEAGQGAGDHGAPEADEHGLREARANRASVRRTSAAFESALAEASRPDQRRWLSGVVSALDGLQAAFDRHIATNEAPGGLLSDMVEQAPRLAHQAKALRLDHDSLTAEIDSLQAGLRALSSGSVDGDQVSDARSRGLRLLHHLSEHRHLGVEIVYEAYFVDIEAAD